MIVVAEVIIPIGFIIGAVLGVGLLYAAVALGTIVASTLAAAFSGASKTVTGDLDDVAALRVRANSTQCAVYFILIYNVWGAISGMYSSFFGSWQATIARCIPLIQGYGWENWRRIIAYTLLSFVLSIFVAFIVAVLSAMKEHRRSPEVKAFEEANARARAQKAY